jgi:hypothetical protein
MDEFIYPVSCPKSEEPNLFVSFPKDKDLFQSSYSIECQTWIWLEEYIKNLVGALNSALPGHIPIPSLSDIVFEYAFDLNDKLRLIIPHHKTFQRLPATFGYFLEDPISRRRHQRNQVICRTRNRKRHLRRARVRAVNREKEQQVATPSLPVQQLEDDRLSESSDSSIVSWSRFLRRLNPYLKYDRRYRYVDTHNMNNIRRSWQQLTVTFEPKSVRESDWRLAYFHHESTCHEISHGLMVQYCHQGKWYPLCDEDQEDYDIAIDVHNKQSQICLRAWSGRLMTTFIRSGLRSNAFIKQLVIDHKP